MSIQLTDIYQNNPNNLISNSHQTEEKDSELFFSILCDRYRLPHPSLTVYNGKMSAIWNATDMSSFQKIYPDAIRTHPEYFKHYIQVLNETFKNNFPTHTRWPSVDEEGAQEFRNRCCNLNCESITIEKSTDSEHDKIVILYEDKQPRWDRFGFHNTFGRISITETGFVTYENNRQLSIKITDSATALIRHDLPPIPPREYESDWES